MTIEVYKKITKDIGIISVFWILTNLSNLFLIPFITKILGAQDYGLYVQTTVTLSLIASIVALGLPYATVRFLAGEKNQNKIRGDIWSSILIIFIISLISSIILIIFSNYISLSLFDGDYILVIILAIIVPVECISGSLQNILRVFQKIKGYTIFNILRTYTEISIIIILVLIGQGINTVILSILFTRTIFLIIIFLLINSMIKIGKPNFSNMKDYLKFGLPTVPSNISSWINNSSSRYIISMFLGTAMVGSYNVAYSIGALVGIFYLAIDFVLISALAEYFNQKKYDLVRGIFKFSIKYYLLFALPAFFGVSILSKQIITVFSTAEIANQSYLVTPFIGFGMLLFGLVAIATDKSIYLAKKNHISMSIWMLVAFINLSLSLLLTPIIGILGAAISTTISFLIAFIISTYFATKYFKFEIDWISTAKILIASIIMSLVIFKINPTSFLNLLFTISIGIIIYFGVTFGLKTIKKEEISLFKSLIGND